MAALTPLNFTAVAPLKLVPVMVTGAPAGAPKPRAGLVEVMAGVTRKLVALVALPPSGLVTPSVPVLAPGGTVAFKEVALTK